MTKDQESALNILITRDDFNYNRLWEFCEHNDIPLKESIRYIAEVLPSGRLQWLQTCSSV